MNFFGLHSYCQNIEYCEPLVWVGLKSAVLSNGSISSSSAYPAAWQTSLRQPMWGYHAVNASALPFGAAALFDRDCYGSSDINDHVPAACPHPEVQGSLRFCLTQQLSNEDEAAASQVFERVGSMLNHTFSYARALGIKTALGIGNGPVLQSWWPYQHRCRASSSTLLKLFRQQRLGGPTLPGDF